MAPKVWTGSRRSMKGGAMIVNAAKQYGVSPWRGSLDCFVAALLAMTV